MSSMRICHCLLENSILEKFLNMHKWESREGIDRHDSSTIRKIYFENCANLFNNPSCEPRSFIHKDLCNDINTSYKLWEMEEAKLPFATPDKIKGKIAESHSKISFSQTFHYPMC